MAERVIHGLPVVPAPRLPVTVDALALARAADAIRHAYWLAEPGALTPWKSTPMESRKQWLRMARAALAAAGCAPGTATPVQGAGGGACGGAGAASEPRRGVAGRGR